MPFCLYNAIICPDTMMQDFLNETNYGEESSRIPSNLELITVYTYGQYFLIEAHPSVAKIRKSLLIDRKTLQIKECGRGEAVAEGYQEKAKFSAFMGLLTILNETYLFLVSTCEKVCAIQAQDIFEVRTVTLILCSEEAHGELRTQVDNYAVYLRDYLLKEGYYFSYDYDLSLSREAYAKGYSTRGPFQWNLNMSKRILQLQDQGWFIGLMQGSIRAFQVFLQGRKVEYILLTRRSWIQGGTRYNARGVDTKGHVANFCETEQLVVVGGYLFSHLQVRGSVPAFWKQSGIYAQVQFYGTHESNLTSCERHLRELQNMYGSVFCVNLLSKQKSGENAITLYFQQLLKELELPFVRYEFYDFHFACKGQKFERSDYLVQKVAPVNHYFQYYSENPTEQVVLTEQKGVFRTNCLDCLDRTNLVQSKIAYQILGAILTKCGFQLENILGTGSIMQAAHSEQTNNFVINLKNAWADNGDNVSKHYTGTGSTHTNVTRTGRRDLKGIMDHGLKSLSRFYKQYMEDNYKQEVIDLLVGQHTATINLAEFEARLKSAKEEELEVPELVQI